VFNGYRTAVGEVEQASGGRCHSWHPVVYIVDNIEGSHVNFYVRHILPQKYLNIFLKEPNKWRHLL
jgi:hypothetical protein